MIRAESLFKSFGALRAVDGVSFEVSPGEIFGLLGPNGAGKTTTISMVSGVLRPDGGRALIGGRDISREPLAVKRELGVVPQEIALYEDMSARDNLSFWASLYGFAGKERRRRVDEALERVGLAERAKDRVAGFSGGMKRRLNLSMGLIHAPKALLLDEPTVGIDPQARLAILELVRAVAREGTAVLFTTHHMEEAEMICERLAIVDHGRVLACGTLEELTKRAGEREVIRLSGRFDEGRARAIPAEIGGLELLSAREGQAVVRVVEGGPGVGEVMPKLLSGALPIEDVSVQRPSLQAVFIALTGRELRD